MLTKTDGCNYLLQGGGSGGVSFGSFFMLAFTGDGMLTVALLATLNTGLFSFSAHYFRKRSVKHE